jgi:hypothetical protein
VELRESIILGIMSLFMIGIIYATFYDKYDTKKGFINESFQQEITRLNDTPVLSGIFASLQDYDRKDLSWIISGKWQLNLADIMENSSNASSNAFSAEMIRTNVKGSSALKHNLSNFKLTYSLINGNTAVVNGTVTISTTGEHGPASFLSAAYTNVPISLKIKGFRVMSLWIDKNTTNKQFGRSLIYGVININ